MSITGLSPIQSFGETNGVTSTAKAENNTGFEALFQSALSLVKETDELTNKAEEKEI